MIGGESATFCVLPWAHLATLTDGSVMLCCVAKNELKLNLKSTTLQDAWNAPEIRAVRLKMLNGDPVSSCANCHVEERNGYRSHRVIENQVWSQRFGKEWIAERIRSTSEEGALTKGMVSLDLRIGNTCNLQCVMCGPQESSRWSALARKLAVELERPELKSEWVGKSRIDLSNFNWFKDVHLWNSLVSLLPDVRELILGGGEPMLLQEHRKLIEACVATGEAKHIQLRYHTNGTVLDPLIFAQWSKFQLVEVFVSLDSYGEKNTYMRHPADWDQITRNLRALETEAPDNVRIMLLCSVHVLNMFYLSEFSEWIQAQGFRRVTHGFNGYFHPGIVHYPPYLSIQNYPPELKARSAEKILAFEERSQKPSSKIQGVLSLMNEGDHSERLPATREYLRTLDRLRGGKSFAEVFPELNNYLEVY